MRTLRTQCLIAGGGPAGVMLGYLLGRAGIEVTVLEKWPDFFRDFRGDTIHPSTMQVLHELGLLEDFLKLPHNEMTRMTIHLDGREVTMADFSYLHIPTPYIAFIPQWDFLNFLSAKAKQFPSFHLLMETEATDLITENGTVLGVRAKDKEGEFEIRADVVVGADGRHSTIREKGRFEVENLSVPVDVLWFRIGRGGEDDKQSLGYLEQGHALVLLDRHDYWQCAFLVGKDSFDDLKAQGLERFRQLVATVAHMPLHAIDEVDSWDKVKLLSVAIDHVREWAKDGVLLIGDSAHAMSPLGGVGINYAIHDAVAAGNILVPAFRGNNLSLHVLRRVQARREKPVKRMQKLQAFLQDRILSPILNEKGQLKMPFFMKLFLYIPPLRSIPARIIGIGFGPEHVRIDF